MRSYFSNLGDFVLNNTQYIVEYNTFLPPPPQRLRPSEGSDKYFYNGRISFAKGRKVCIMQFQKSVKKHHLIEKHLQQK
jgi:hypothetical protein